MSATVLPEPVRCKVCKGIASRNIKCGCGWAFTHCAHCGQVADLFRRVHTQRHADNGEQLVAAVFSVLRGVEVANG